MKKSTVRPSASMQSRTPSRASSRTPSRSPAVKLTADERRLLLAVTSLPTASGCEHAVQRALDLWVSAFGGAVHLRRDDVGNALITTAVPERTQRKPHGKGRRRVDRESNDPLLLITAHIDHPAFVVRRALTPRVLELEFRGGVHDPYFQGAELEIFPAGGLGSNEVTPSAPFPARISKLDAKAQPFKIVHAEIGDRSIDAGRVAPGSIARWHLPPAEITGGLLRTHACDDLAAVATALIAFTRLHRVGSAARVGLLFTVAEEVGFLGAIRAARSGIIPRGATLLCLENSRSFPHDSPIGAGAILRVGDRLSVFSPEVTNALTQLYQRHAAAHPTFRWQRKLMPGGACEATAFAALGHASTCLCLPLGNYHNMSAIDEVLAGTRRAEIGREFVAISDIESLVAMLTVAAQALAPSRPVEPATLAEAPAALGDFRPMMEKLWLERSKSVLGVS